jgi:hypothetical protein
MLERVKPKTETRSNLNTLQEAFPAFVVCFIPALPLFVVLSEQF